MADTATLGKLLVELLFEDAQFQAGLTGAQKSLKKAGADMSRFAKGVQGQVTTALKGAALAAAGFAAATTVVGATFQKQMSAVGAVKGLETASEGFQDLTDRARELGSTTAFTATEAAKGMEALGRAGLSTTEIMDTSRNALELAGAGQIELGRSAEILAASMSQFNLTAADSARIADVVTATTQNSLFATEDWAQSMKFAGTVGAALGKSIEETSATLAQFRDLGLEGSMAGTSFRKAVTSLAGPTEVAKETLASLGLTLEDVNPATNDLRDVFRRLGEAQLTTADASAIFGNKAGLNIKKVADAMGQSTDDFDTLLSTLENAGGTTAATYEKMTDNVLGSLSILRSAFEEVFLGLFDTFKAPLQDLIDAVTGVVGQIGTQLTGASADISDSFTSIIGEAAAFIRTNGEEIAGAVVNIVRAFQDLVETVQPAATSILQVGLALSGLLPILDELIIAFGLFLGAQKVFAFTTAIIGLVEAFGLAAAAAETFGTAVVVSTGGLAALVAAVVALSAGLGIFLARQVAARREAALLADASAAMGQEFGTLDEALVALSADLQQNADKWAALNDSMQMTFDTVERSSRGAIEAEIEFLEALQEGGELSDKEAKKLTRKRAELAGFDQAKADSAKKEAAQARALAAELAAVREADAASAQSKADEELARKQKIADAIRDFQATASEATASTLSESDQRLEAAAREIDGLERAAEAAKKGAVNEQERAGIATAAARAIAGVNDQLAADLDDIRTKQGKKDFEAAVKARALAEENAQKVRDMLAAIDDDRRSIAGEFFRFVAEGFAKVVSGAAKAAVAAGKAVAGAMSATIGAIKSALGALGGVVGGLTGGVGIDPSAIVKAALDEQMKAEQQLSDLRMQLADEEDAEKRADIEAQIALAEANAAKTTEERSAGGVDTLFDQAIAFAEGFSGSIREILATVIQRIPEAMGAILEALPVVVEALAEGLPILLQRVLDMLPSLIQALVDAIPTLLDAVMAAVSSILTFVVDQLPGLIQTLMTALADIITRLLDELPNIISTILGALPGIITAILDALPGIITKILEAIPILIAAILSALPGIITSILKALPAIIISLIDGVLSAIPTIIIAIVEAIPQIVIAIVEAIPGIIMAIVGAIPNIITSIIGAIPDIILALVRELPKMIPTLLGMIPTVIVGILSELPGIIFSLFKAFFFELPKQVPKIIVEAVKALVEAIGKALKSVGEATEGVLFTPSGKLIKQSREGGGAFSGIDFVPSVQRITVHPGEAVVPADRNPRGIPRGGIAGPALAGGQAAPGGASGGQPVNIALVSDGRMLEEIQVRSDARGTATRVQRRARFTSGTKLGIDRGPFNQFGGG